ncbi:MAG TPA: 30S ribosomal protein S6 [Candidatus Onthousia faecipullorum]|uniref:Small ribosomal subunit protein bS6 n=1 Tax=Candidatus Onthousia faecipullorum TaxID=2840887 RepID=A0A9D1GC16_9FIRM|nr:30S ribosomal protein S6 [Candidatus Onthousia faecipullorum]
MTNYEIMFIVKPDLDEAAIKKEAENLKKVLTDRKCKINEEKAMGQKELAYEMNKYKNGYYFLYVVEANNEAISEFDRLARLSENILRHLVIKLDD